LVDGRNIRLEVRLAEGLLADAAGVTLHHVPFTGAGPAITALLGGHVDALATGPGTVIQHIKAGKLRALATTGAKRDPALPDLPTLAEAGVAGYESGVWFGLSAPAATPKDVIQRMTKLQINSLTLRNFRNNELTAHAGDLILPSENTRCQSVFWAPLPLTRCEPSGGSTLQGPCSSDLRSRCIPQLVRKLCRHEQSWFDKV
jgi:hypothetical protein